MKLLVCGGRDYADVKRLYQILDDFKNGYPDLEICHGGARGADTLAGQWAKDRGIKCTVFPADWGRYGRGAGPVRNKQMLDEFNPDAIMAFPGGRGTKNMIDQAEAAKVAVCVCEE